MRFSRRQYLLSMAAGVCSGMQRSNRPPNLVVVLADDLGYGDLGVYGSTTIRTPHLDRMGREGTRLTDFYATPTCTPSRAALFTGRYPIRSGLVRVLQASENFGIPDSETTLGEALKPLGYTTALIGKWHLGSRPRFRPNRHGFDFYYGLLYSNDMTMEPPNLRRLRLYRNQTPIEWPVHQDTLTRRYTEQAVAFIEANRTKPFFLCLAHTMPHVPLHASEQFRGRSSAGLYGDAVEEIDWSTGQLLAALQRLSLDENTLVVFTSDNGPAVKLKQRGGSAGPFRGGKGTTWEGGIRVPMVARWPGAIPTGTVRHGIASLMDIFPTFVKLGGGELPKDRTFDGSDIFPMLTGDGTSPHEEIYDYFGAHVCAVRWRNWKLHLRAIIQATMSRRSEKLKSPELYDLDADPSESKNVAASQPEVVARLSAMVERFTAGVKPGKLPPRLPMSLR